MESAVGRGPVYYIAKMIKLLDAFIRVGPLIAY